MKRLLAILLLPLCALAQPTSNVFTEINVSASFNVVQFYGEQDF